MASESNRDFDDILIDIAKEIRKASDVDNLGKKLGFSISDIKGYQVANNQGKDYDGTLDMLRVWSHKHPDDQTRETLMIKALVKMERIDLREKHFGFVEESVAAVPQGARSREQNRFSMASTGPHGGTGQSHQSPSYVDKWENSCVKICDPRMALDSDMNYNMWGSLVKGNALILANENFAHSKRRAWAEMDINNMETLLKHLGYDNPNKYRDQSKQEMEETVQLFTNQLDAMNPQPQSAVVYISSHGSEQGIEGTDGCVLSIPTLLKQFSGVLLGKPKIIIIDACWGGGITQLVPNSMRNSSGTQPNEFPENADIFMIHSTSLGKVSWSYGDTGSWLVDQLCEVMYDTHRHLEDLDTIMLRVTRGLHRMTAYEDGKKQGTQTATVLKQGVKQRLFFFPGLVSPNP